MKNYRLVQLSTKRLNGFITSKEIQAVSDEVYTLESAKAVIEGNKAFPRYLGEGVTVTTELVIMTNEEIKNIFKKVV